MTGAIIANSIALLADSAHLSTDIIGFAISVASLVISQRPATSTLSYGYHRAEVLGTLFSMFFLWLITIVLVYAATLRFIYPSEILGGVMFVTAVLGLFFNLIQMSILDSTESPVAVDEKDLDIHYE
jgi:zinc transporter 2